MDDDFKNSLAEIPLIFSFLILFFCILLSASDFFIVYLALEGISFVLYTLSSICSESYINIEAIIKYFVINNLASLFVL
jgi:NADH:ubiquinone oxidoreductase subunit 2 (subunit N)